MSLLHFPVMLRQVSSHLKMLALNPQRTYLMVDCTVGTGAHAVSLLKEYPNLHILGLDLDPRMVQHLEQSVLPTLTEDIKARFKVRNESYISVQQGPGRVFPELQLDLFDIIFADLGYNSMHVNEPSWGFSYLNDGQLDMRYNPKYKKCSEILGSISQIELVQVLTRYGQIDKTTSAIISKSLLDLRSHQSITRTKQIQAAINSTNIRDKFKFLVKVFQALRIYTNSEFEDVKKLCSIIPSKLSPNGKAMVITFHSLEHSVAKSGFLHQKSQWKATHRLYMESPTAQQIEQNVSSRSASMLILDPKPTSTKTKYSDR